MAECAELAKGQPFAELAKSQLQAGDCRAGAGGYAPEDPLQEGKESGASCLGQGPGPCAGRNRVGQHGWP